MPEIAGHRARHQLQRDVPSRKAAEAHHHRRRRLYRQRVRRHLPSVREQGDAGEPHRRPASRLRPAGRRPPAPDRDPQGHRFQVPRDDRGNHEARRRLVARPDDRLRRHRDGRGAVRGRAQAQYRRPRLRGSRRRGRRHVRDQGRRGQSHQRSVDLRRRRRHRPRPAHAGGDPRGAGVRRHLLRQQAARGSITIASRQRGVQPSAAGRGRNDRGRRRATSSAR